MPADCQTLQALIQQLLDEREATAQAIADSFGRNLPAGHDTYLLLDRPEGRPGRLRGHERGASILKAPMRGDTPHVIVAIEPPEVLALAEHPLGAPPGSFKDWQDRETNRWREIFAAADVTFTEATSTSAHDAVAELLGHMMNELWLIETPPTAD